MKPQGAGKHVALSVITFGAWLYVWAYRVGVRADAAYGSRSRPLLSWAAFLGPIAVLQLITVLVLSLVVVLDATGVLGTAWEDDAAPPTYFWVMMAASLLVNLFWVPAAVLLVVGLWRVWQVLPGEADRVLMLALAIAGAAALPPLLLVPQWMSQKALDADAAH